MVEAGKEVEPPFVLKINNGVVDVITKAIELDTLTEESRGSPTLRFTEHTNPWSASFVEGDNVVLEYEPGTIRFRGKITSTKGRERNGRGTVDYECQSYQHLASNVQLVRVPATGGNTPDPFPQRIYNCPEGDPDKLHEEADGQTIGQIITSLFEDFQASMRNEGAIRGGQTGFVAADLALMGRIPEKFVLQGDLQQVFQQCLAEQGPGWAIYVEPEMGIWRFYNRFDLASNETLTIGTDDIAGIDVQRSLDDVHTAVRVVGRPGRGGNIIPARAGFGIDETNFSHGFIGKNLTALWDPALENDWTREKMTNYSDSGIVSTVSRDEFTVAGRNWPIDLWKGGVVMFPTHSYEKQFTVLSSNGNTIQLTENVPDDVRGEGFRAFDIAGGNADVFRYFQITDEDKRGILLDDAGNLGCCPKVVAIGRDSNGNVSFRQPVKIRVEGDPREGKFRTEDPLFQSPTNGREPGDSSLSDHARLEYCYEEKTSTNTLEARFPSSGFSGEAFGAPYHIDRELVVIADDFEDQLDVGIFAAAAQEIHKRTSKVLTRGRLPLAGIDWTLHDLRKLVNISHNTEPTGWEALNAGVASVTWNFGRNSTSIQLSDDGGSDVIDYPRLFETVRARTRAVVSQENNLNTSGFLDCIGEGITNRTGGVNAIAAEEEAEKVGDSATWPTTSYSHFPAGGSQRHEDGACPCDAAGYGDPCLPGVPDQLCPRICFLDGQVGLSLRHPGLGSASIACRDSQLLFGAKGMYFPFMCQGIPINIRGSVGAPDDKINAICANGTRKLVTLEPVGMDDGFTGTEVGIGEALIHFVQAYDAYIQRNEDAHCCLDMKVSCIDAGVWGPADGGTSSPCFPGDLFCERSVMQNLSLMNTKLEALASVCCTSWDFELKDNCCGPC